MTFGDRRVVDEGKQKVEDARKLGRLLDEKFNDLHGEEQDAFQRMLDVAKRPGTKLSQLQRDWFEDRYRKLELDADDVEGLTDKQKEEAAKLGPLQVNWGPMALKPPPRKR